MLLYTFNNKFFSLCNSLVLIGNSYDSIFDDIIIPLLDHIGKQWLDGKIDEFLLWNPKEQGLSLEGTPDDPRFAYVKTKK